MIANDRTPHSRGHGPIADSPRRGVTLIEMLVTIAVLVIIMTILAQIFQAATGAVSAAQAYQALDDQLRRIDGILRADLEGATATFTPAGAVLGDQRVRNGYFEYSENEFADNQGEDSDDYIRFTAKAPPGQPFTGRIWVTNWLNPATGSTYGPNPNPGAGLTSNMPSFPATITSDFAEIIYFLRNGNLYRRVVLILPELQSAITQMVKNVTPSPTGNPVEPPNYAFQPTSLGGNVASWQGVNDISARPTSTGTTTSPIVLNTLTDLANRENRFAYPRFANDYWTVNATTGGYSTGPDGIPDDMNNDNIPDLYPSLYPNLVNIYFSGGTGLIFAPLYPSGVQPTQQSINLLAFPYVYPGAYSRSQTLSSGAYSQYGWIHSPSPVANYLGQEVFFDKSPINYLNSINHNPLDMGDNLPTPANPLGTSSNDTFQTWWGFPTWRETLSPLWYDPTYPVNTNLAQPPGLSYSILANSGATGILHGRVNPLDANLLPPMAQPSNFTGVFSQFRQTQQLYSDAAGQNSAFWPNGGANATSQLLWQASWEDDLIMTGVRSFDVKAFDSALGNYMDLGWGDDLRPQMTQTWASNAFLNYVANKQTPPVPFLAGNMDYSPLLTGGNAVYPPRVQIGASFVDYINQSFAHEGRIPPLITDNRLDAQNPNPFYISYNNFTAQYAAFPKYSSNVGDNDANNAGVVRLRRVWDSWSIEYSQAPATSVNSNTGGFPNGPYFSPPVYPSYPPPYPAPLRGIQIQIRVVDPTNQRIKSLTIRQDFTDKL